MPKKYRGVMKAYGTRKGKKTLRKAKRRVKKSRRAIGQKLGVFKD